MGKGRRRKKREGGPSDPNADATAGKRERDIGGWGRKVPDCCAVLEMSWPSQ